MTLTTSNKSAECVLACCRQTDVAMNYQSLITETITENIMCLGDYDIKPYK